MSDSILSRVGTGLIKKIDARARAFTDPFALIESGALKIQTKAGALIPLTPETMKPGQLRAYLYIKTEYQAGRPVRVRWLKYRQGGFSTLAELIMFAVTMCNENYHTLVLSNLKDSAQWIFDMSNRFQDTMEKDGKAWLRKKISQRQEIVWQDSGSGIRIGSAETKNIGITMTRQGLHGSETAYWRGWTALWGNLAPSIPYLPRTIVILESTANGSGDHWHQSWEAGERGEGGYHNEFFSWTEDPDYARTPRPGWEPGEEDLEAQELYGLTLEQMYWRREIIDNDFAGNVAMFKEKYPATAKEAFRSTGSIVFDTIRPTLDTLIETSPGGLIYQVEDWDGVPRLRPDPHGPVEVLVDRRKGDTFVMYSDAGEGLKNVDTDPIVQEGETIDTTYSTCIVRRISDWALCAILECRYPPDIFAQVAGQLGKYYNEALWAIEIPGPGMAVIAHAQHSYPRLKIYRRTWRDAKNEFREKTEYGFRNDAQTKPIMESDWEAVVRDHPELLPSARIAGQAMTYIRDPKTGKHRPKSGCFSDLLLADMGCIQILKSTPREDPALKKAMDYQKQKRDERIKGYRRSHFR